MDRVHLVDEERGDRYFGEHGSKQFIVVQVVADEVGDFDGSSGLGVEFVIVLQFGDGYIGQLGVQFLNGRVQSKVPASDSFIIKIAHLEGNALSAHCVRFKCQPHECKVT